MYANRRHLQQVLLTLFRDAIDRLPKSNRKLRVSIYQSSDSVEVNIRNWHDDTYKSQELENNFSIKICKAIAKQHQGEICFTNHSEGGSLARLIIGKAA